VSVCPCATTLSTTPKAKSSELTVRMQELCEDTETLIKLARAPSRNRARSRRESVSKPSADQDEEFTKALLKEVAKYDGQPSSDSSSESKPDYTSHADEAERPQRFAKAWRHEIPDLWGPAEQLLTTIQLSLDCVGVTQAERVREEHARFFAVIRATKQIS
jgi:hypothetical protein